MNCGFPWLSLCGDHTQRLNTRWYAPNCPHCDSPITLSTEATVRLPLAMIAPATKISIRLPVRPDMFPCNSLSTTATKNTGSSDMTHPHRSINRGP